MDYSLRLTFTLNVSREDLKDILGVACFGGINYWACLNESTDTNDTEFLNGEAYCVTDAEDEDEYLGVLDEMTMLKGIERAVEGGYFAEYNWYRFAEGNHIEIDMYNVDSDVADVIVQLGMFDDIIYG